MNKKTKLIIGIVVVLVAVIFTFINSQKQSSDVPDSLTFGLMLPLTGDYAAAGQNMQKGMEIAIEQYKKENPNTNIKVVIEDDAYDAVTGVSAYKKLVDLDKIDILLMLSTPVIDAIHEDVVERGIPVIQLGVQTVGIADDNIIQFSPAAEAPIGNLATYLNENELFYNNKVAVVYDNSPAQVSFYATFENEYEKEFTSMVSNGKDDLRSYATRIVNEDFGAVVFIMSPENGALLTKEILTLDTTPPLFAYDAQLQTGFGDYERILGDTNKINGALSLWFKAGKMDELTKLYEEKYGEAPGFLADFSYDMVTTAFETYDVDNVKWNNNLKNFTNNDGASGPISFDEKGVRIQPMVITEVQNGKLVTTVEI